MAGDPFSLVIAGFGRLAPRVATDALEEQDLLPAMLAEVRAFCAERVDGARIDRDGRLGPELLTEVAARGWFGLTLPAEHGGAGLSLAAATRIVSELAAFNGSLGTCVGLHSGLALHALLHLGSPALHQRYLPEIAAGKRIASFAATEPSAGSDISAVKTTLAEVEGRLILDGEKCYVTNGGLCGLVTVLARSPGLGGARAGHTLVLVDPSWPGVTRGVEERKMGLKGSSTVTLRFEGVTIPPDHLLGEPSHGLELAHQALTWGRTFMAAGCLGSARAALGAATEHVRTREQFGRPLARFGLVREALAQSRAEVHAIETTLRLVTALYDTDAGDIALPSTIVKVLASEGAFAVVDRSLQLMGGAGYIEDNGMARRARDVRITRIFEGANDVLRVSLASAAIGWPVARLEALATLPLVPRELGPEAQRFDAVLGSVVGAVKELKKRWGFRLFEQQPIAVELADALGAQFTALGLLARAASCADAADRELSRLALHLQLERAAESARRAVSPRDPELVSLLDAVGARDTSS